MLNYFRETLMGIFSSQPSEEQDSTALNSERSRNHERYATVTCSYTNLGCNKKRHFSEAEVNQHEQNCKYRTSICPIPILSRGTCDWVGSHHKLSAHLQDVHPTHFTDNLEFLPTPDLTKSNQENILFTYFTFECVLHIKVCLTSGKLFHSVRMFGNPELLDKFSYSLDVFGNECETIPSEFCSVLSDEILTIDETIASFILIENLLDMFENGHPLFFHFYIHTKVWDCLNCSRNIATYFNYDVLKFCGSCTKQLVKCKFHNKGCLFVDMNSVKCEKHEAYFCEYQTKCWFCKMKIVGGSLIKHLASSYSCRKTIKTNIDSVVRLTSQNSHLIVFSTILLNIEPILCQYSLSDSHLILHLRTSLPSHELKNIKYSIELTDPQTKHSQTLTPQIKYDYSNDWSIYENMDNFPSWESIGIDIKINMDKINHFTKIKRIV